MILIILFNPAKVKSHQNIKINIQQKQIAILCLSSNIQHEKVGSKVLQQFTRP